MNVELYLAFLAVSFVIIIVPGPNVTLILATAATSGIRAGLMTVAGTTAAQILQVIAVAMGLVWLVVVYGSLFDVLRYVGAAYLVYLGILAWRTAGVRQPDAGSASYILLAVILDSAYAVAGGMGQRLLATDRSRLYLGRASGVVLAGGGLWLASLKRD